MIRNETVSDVLSNGLCVGCGSCAFYSQARMEENRDGFYTPRLSLEAASSNEVARVCPFSNLAKNEDQIASDVFDPDMKHDPSIGRYLAIYAGYSREISDLYGEGTSGGIISWIIHELLASGAIDYVVHAKETRVGGKFEFRFGFTSSKNTEELLQKSKYYPTELSEVLDLVKRTDGRAAIVGLPCQIKAVRLLQGVDEDIAQKVKFCIGLVCGHLKSKRYADYLASACAGKLNITYQSIDFRNREVGSDVADYNVRIETDSGELTMSMKSIFASGWQYNLFRNAACDFCDDVFSETADISVGDVWLDRYRHRDQAHSLIVVRNQRLYQQLRAGSEDRRVSLEDLPVAEAIRSQAGGLRDRRVYLAERIRMKLDDCGVYIKKRVTPRVKPAGQLSQKVRLRSEIAAASHIAWRKAIEGQDIEIFKAEIEKFKTMIDSLDASSRPRLVQALKRFLPPKLRARFFWLYAQASHLFSR